MNTTFYRTVFYRRLGISFFLSSLVFIVFTVFSNSLFAKGVNAGTDISNLAIVSYSQNGQKQVPIESSPTGNKLPGVGNGKATIFKVDRKIDLIVTSNGDTQVKPGDARAKLSFTLKNDGNDIQEFQLIPNSAISADDFDTNSCTVKITAVSGTPLPGVVIPSFEKIKLKQDQDASISVICDIPFNNNGQPILLDQISLLSLKATAVKNNDGSDVLEDTVPDVANTTETIFTDAAGSDDNNRDASHSARSKYIAIMSTIETLPSLNISKAIIEVKDPKGGSEAITGSDVTYKITINTEGKGTINNVVITDPTPVGMTYKTNTMTLNSVNLTDLSDTDNGEFDAINNVSIINLGDIAAGSQYQIQLTYTIK